MHIASIGIDLGKTTFHLVALEEQGKVVVRKKFSRKQLLAYTANLQSSLIGIEACSGAHFISAGLRRQGHDVRLIPAQFVKPYVKSNKNDFACCTERTGGHASGTAEQCAQHGFSGCRRRTC
jgi:transposase